MAWLTAGEILGAKDLKRSSVEVPEWGGEVGIRELSLLDRDVLQKAAAQGATELRLAALVVARCAIGVNGASLFDDAEADKIAEHNASVVTRVAQAIAALSTVSEAKIEEAEKNSASVPSDASSSASPTD